MWHKLGLGLLLCAALPVMAAKKEISIQSDTSNLPAPLVNNFAHVAVSMGIKEPLHISKEQNVLMIRGNSSVQCAIKLNDAYVALNVSCR